MNRQPGDKVVINGGLRKGQTATITEVIPTGYRIDLDGGRYVWGDHMFYDKPPVQTNTKQL